jgi:hypothetical protein
LFSESVKVGLKRLQEIYGVGEKKFNIDFMGYLSLLNPENPILVTPF